MCGVVLAGCGPTRADRMAEAGRVLDGVQVAIKQDSRVCQSKYYFAYGYGRGGTVWVQGEVPSLEVRHAVEEDARGVPGVTVVNTERLTINPNTCPDLSRMYDPAAEEQKKRQAEKDALDQAMKDALERDRQKQLDEANKPK